MGRPELGTKLACSGCSERFYDLNRSPAVCPKCGMSQVPAQPRAARKAIETWRARRPPASIVADADGTEAVEAAEDEAEAEDDGDVEEIDDGPDEKAEVASDVDSERG
jgi:uncharacterized protein (TIGR02300 family)